MTPGSRLRIPDPSVSEVVREASDWTMRGAIYQNMFWTEDKVIDRGVRRMVDEAVYWVVRQAVGEEVHREPR